MEVYPINVTTACHSNHYSGISAKTKQELLQYLASINVVCSLWSCAFLTLCSIERRCARESTFFILPGKSNFRAINFFLQTFNFPLMYFTKSHEILMRRKGMHMTKMNRLYLDFLKLTKIFIYY